MLLSILAQIFVVLICQFSLSFLINFCQLLLFSAQYTKLAKPPTFNIKWLIRCHSSLVLDRNMNTMLKRDPWTTDLVHDRLT